MEKITETVAFGLETLRDDGKYCGGVSLKLDSSGQVFSAF